MCARWLKQMQPSVEGKAIGSQTDMPSRLRTLWNKCSASGLHSNGLIGMEAPTTIRESGQSHMLSCRLKENTLRTSAHSPKTIQGNKSYLPNFGNWRFEVSKASHVGSCHKHRDMKNTLAFALQTCQYKEIPVVGHPTNCWHF